MRIRLDRTVCDGFGLCAKHAPEYFSLDDWGYASLVGNGEVPRPTTMRSCARCWTAPCTPSSRWANTGSRRRSAHHDRAVQTIRPRPKTEANEAEWGFTR